MAHPINMPQVGQDIETAVITEWKVKVGDRVGKGDVVALVESDKAVFEVEAFESGIVLQLLFREDEEARVLEPIAFIGEEGEEPGVPPAAIREAALNRKDGYPVEFSDRREDDPGVVRLTASPSARRLAAELGVSLGQVEGSGPQGRIIGADIRRAAEARRAELTDPSRPDSGKTDDLGPAGDLRVPFSRMRQSIADRLTRSVQTIPHFYLDMKADVSEFMAWREQYLDRTGRKISVNDLVIKAAAAALLEYPRMNAHVAADSTILCGQVNIGVAVSLEEGLIVPVIPDTPSLDLAKIAAKVAEIGEAARRGMLIAGPAGTFTVTNLGMLGVSRFQPIINPPEAGILGVGAIEKQLILLPDGQVGGRDLLPLTLGCDHRAVDGFYAGRFLQAVREEIGRIELWQAL